MNQPWIYMCFPSQSPLPPAAPPHPSGSSQCTSPEHLSYAFKLGWRSVSPLIIYMFRCCSLKTSHPGSISGSGRSPGEGIGFPLQYSWASLVTQLVKNPPAIQETWVQSQGQEDPLEKGKPKHIYQWHAKHVFMEILKLYKMTLKFRG